MSILPENYQPAVTPLYCSLGSSLQSELTPFITKPLTVNQSVIITELSESLLPRVNCTYSLSVGLVLDVELPCSVTLQYDDRHYTVIAPELDPTELTLSILVTKVLSPTVPLRLVLTNLTGANITEGSYKIETLAVMELPTPKILTKDNL